MQRQQLMPNQIAPRRQTPGDRRLPVQILQHLCSAPVPTTKRRRTHTLLVNLEPLLAAAVAGGEVAARALVQPYHDGALLVGPLLPDCFYFAAGGDFGG